MNRTLNEIWAKVPEKANEIVDKLCKGHEGTLDNRRYREHVRSTVLDAAVIIGERFEKLINECVEHIFKYYVQDDEESIDDFIMDYLNTVKEETERLYSTIVLDRTEKRLSKEAIDETYDWMLKNLSNNFKTQTEKLGELFNKYFNR